MAFAAAKPVNKKVKAVCLFKVPALAPLSALIAKAKTKVKVQAKAAAQVEVELEVEAKTEAKTETQKTERKKYSSTNRSIRSRVSTEKEKDDGEAVGTCVSIPNRAVKRPSVVSCSSSSSTSSSSSSSASASASASTSTSIRKRSLIYDLTEEDDEPPSPEECRESLTEAETKKGLALYHQLTAVKRRRLDKGQRDTIWLAGKFVKEITDLKAVGAELCRQMERHKSNSPVRVMGFDLGVTMTVVIALVWFSKEEEDGLEWPRVWIVLWGSFDVGDGKSTDDQATTELFFALRAFFKPLPEIDRICIEAQPSKKNHRTFALSHSLKTWLQHQYMEGNFSHQPLIQMENSKKKISLGHELAIEAPKDSYYNSYTLNKDISTQTCLKILTRETAADATGTMKRCLEWWHNQPKRDDYADALLITLASFSKERRKTSSSSSSSSYGEGKMVIQRRPTPSSVAMLPFPPFQPVRKKIDKATRAKKAATKRANLKKVAPHKGALYHFIEDEDNPPPVSVDLCTPHGPHPSARGPKSK